MYNQNGFLTEIQQDIKKKIVFKIFLILQEPDLVLVTIITCLEEQNVNRFMNYLFYLVYLKYAECFHFSIGKLLGVFH